MRCTSRCAAESRPQIRPTTCGRNGSLRLRSGLNSPSAASWRRSLFQPGQQLPDADRPDVQGRQRERSAGGVEVRLGVHDHPGALAGRGIDRLEHAPGADHPDRDGRRRVAEGEEHRPAAPGQLGDLPVDPDAAQPGNPAADQLQHRPDGDRRFGRCLQGHDPGRLSLPRVSSLVTRRSNIAMTSGRLACACSYTDELADLDDREAAQPGAQRGDRQLLVVGDWRCALLGGWLRGGWLRGRRRRLSGLCGDRLGGDRLGGDRLGGGGGRSGIRPGTRHGGACGPFRRGGLRSSGLPGGRGRGGSGGRLFRAFVRARSGGLFLCPRLVLHPVGDQPNLADAGEHGTQRVRRCLLNPFADLREAHIESLPERGGHVQDAIRKRFGGALHRCVVPVGILAPQRSRYAKSPLVKAWSPAGAPAAHGLWHTAGCAPSSLA